MSKKNLFDLTLAFAILALALSGCFTREMIPDPTLETPVFDTEQPAEVDGPRLRVENRGLNDIHNLTVLFPDSRIVFGDVPAGTTTSYLSAPNGVYNYAAYSFELNGEQITQPVIDWVGESPRPGETFTYVIDFDPARPQMQWIRLITIHDP